MAWCMGITSMAQGEVLRALSARPVPGAEVARAKSQVREHYIYQFESQSLPLMDDFSIDRTRKRWTQPGDDDVTLQEVIYRLVVNGVSTPDMEFSLDTTFRFIVDVSDPDTVIVTQEALPEALVTLRDLDVYPPTEIEVSAWPPYTIFDTLSFPTDTLYQFTPDLIQDSLMVYLVAADTRTYNMNGIIQPLILWEDDDVYVNGTYPLNPPTVGVATFDGLARNGLPYDFANFSAYGIADRLTSVPIELNRPASDSIYLSFYYQAQGLSGDGLPQLQDSLVLEFYAPLEDIWYRVWRTPYIGLGPFQQAIIPIKEFKYLQNGFRMRFLNYATLSGAFDHWHLDYVRLAAQRTFDDTTLVDVAYVYPESSILQTYTSIPFNRFAQSPGSLMAPSVSVLQRNLDDEDRLVTWRMRGFIDGGTPGPLSGILNSSIAGNASSIFPSEHAINSPPNNFQYDPSLSTDAAFWRVQFVTNTTPDFNSYNDTISFVQELSNYYSYDDGSAEMGYGLNTGGARLAYQYDLLGADSLRAIRMYFNPMANEPPLLQPTQGNFLITVWSQLVPEEVIIHQNFSFSSPQYRDHGLNKFVEYELDSAIAVEGTIFIGWVQTNGANMNLGFDRNRNNQNKIFFRVGNNWQNTSFQGSLMMRPVMVSEVDPFLGVADGPVQGSHGLALYPNPASDQFHIRFTEAMVDMAVVECLDATGRLVLQDTWYPGMGIATAPLSNGIYLVRASDRSGNLLGSSRLLIQR
jgi:hypothetical protein